MNIYNKILKEQFGITDVVSHPLRNMNTVTDEQTKHHNLLTDKMFKEFQKEVINCQLP